MDIALTRKALRLSESAQTTDDYTTGKLAMEVEEPLKAALAALQDSKVGPWRIYYDPPPIGTRICDWHYIHDDCDGPESPSWMHGSCESREACLVEIMEAYDDRITERMCAGGWRPAAEADTEVEKFIVETASGVRGEAYRRETYLAPPGVDEDEDDGPWFEWTWSHRSTCGCCLSSISEPVLWAIPLSALPPAPPKGS